MPYIGTSPSNGVRQTYDYTATAGQTSFSGSDNNSQTLTYTDSAYIDVYQNGILLVPSDYTATTGTTVVLDTGATVSDTVQIIAYDVFSVADTVSASDGGSFGGNVTVGGAFTSLGIDDNANATAITITSDENVGVGTTSPTNFGGTNLHVNHATTYASSLFQSNARTIQILCSDANGVQSIGTRSNHPLDITTNDNAKIKITANGEVTMPSQPAFSAQPTSDINNITGDATTAALTNVDYTEYFDVNADFNHDDGTNRGKFTAPVTGKYYLGYTLCYSGTTSASTSGVHALSTSNRTYNNNFNPYNHANVGVNGNIVFSAICDMDANDTAHVTLYVNGNGAKVVDILASQHKFFGMLIG